MILNDMEQASSVRWGDSGADPLADIQRFREQMQQWPSARPNVIWASTRVWRRIQRSLYRQTHGKRAWRRQRGKLKEAGQW